jgi:RNA polymerase sigma factor (sigma-70 family)
VGEHLHTSGELLDQVRAGDGRAAEELFGRYMERLTRLARVRLSRRLASRTDPEDVVLSAWRSFFVGAAAGRFSLERSGDLWRLLVAITLNKLYRQARRHSATRRSVAKERPLDSVPEGHLPAGEREPTPEEAVSLADELEAVMTRLDSFARRVLELRLQGNSVETIAVETDRSERTVRRTLAEIRKSLTARLEREHDG